MNTFTADAPLVGKAGTALDSTLLLVGEGNPNSLMSLHGRLEFFRETAHEACRRAEGLADRLSGPVPQPNTANSGTSPVPDGILASLHLEATGLEHWLEGLRGELGRIEKALG